MAIIYLIPLGVFQLFLDRGYKLHLTTPPIIGNTTNNGIKCIQCMINSQYQTNEKKTRNILLIEPENDNIRNTYTLQIHTAT